MRGASQIAAASSRDAAEETTVDTASLWTGAYWPELQMMQYPLWNDVDDGMMFASVALVIFMIIALPWQRRVWDRSQPPPDMLDRLRQRWAVARIGDLRRRLIATRGT